MLIEFTVGNFRSFKEPETFSMVAANLTSPNPSLDTANVISIDKDLKLLTSAALYGRNSSGKSNLLAALRFMRDFVLNSSKDTQATDPIPTERFRLSTETRDKPSFFEIAFIVEGHRYRYGFEVDPRRVVSEWLFTVPTIREAMLFQREEGEIDISSRFKEGRGLQGRTRPNALLLSVAAQFNGDIATKIVHWFDTLNLFGLEDWHLNFTVYHLFMGKEKKQKIIKLVKQFDLGIENIRIDRDPFEDEITFINTEKEWAQEDKQMFHASAALRDRRVMTEHQVYDGDGNPLESESFDLQGQGSEGTKKLFAMAGFLVNAVDAGFTLLVDELDVKLHPLITRAIIALFNSKETNPKGAQLIFTTHDANLLDNKLLRRDQIWFVEKDRYNASHLVSLAEYRVRKEASFEKDYLQGRYGGIPSLGDLSHLFEETHA